MSADFRTEHFKGWQHDGYVHVVNVSEDGTEWGPMDLTAAEVAELASMFQPDGDEGPAIQYFGSDATWIRPERAAAIDVLVQAGGGGGTPGQRGGDGGIQVKRFYAPDIPPTMDIQIGRGGRPGGRDGYVLVVTHLASEEGGHQ